MDVDALGWEVLEGIGGGLGAGQSLFLSKTILSNFIYEYDLLRSYPQLQLLSDPSPTCIFQLHVFFFFFVTH